MTTVGQHVANMRAALAITLPDLDTTVGTTARKMVDAFAEELAAAGVDLQLLSYRHDIDTKSGPDLDDFVAQFGQTRRLARRASGSVMLERTTEAPASIFIPAGSEFATEDEPPVVFLTTVPAVLTKGSTSVNIPVQAVLGGTEGNVAPGGITRRITPVEGISSISNPLAMTGGTDEESDEALRARFKRTVFRNFAGTEQMFLGLALEHDEVGHANVIGATKTFREQIEVVSGEATSTISNAAHIFQDSSSFGADIDAGDVLMPGIHYTFDHTVNPPTITVLDGGTAPDGIYDLEFEYLPSASRNDPANGITNRVDVWVNGVRIEEAVETVIFRLAQVFETGTGGPLDRANWERENGTAPTAGNFFVRFAHGPVLDPAVSDFLVINAVTYEQGVHFWLVRDTSARGGAPRSLSGVEFLSTANGLVLAEPEDGDVFSVDYTFNRVPSDIEDLIDEWRLVGIDVWVHEAKRLVLNMYMAVILEPGYGMSSVLPTVRSQVRALIDRVGFSDVLQVSDLMSVVSQVPGIDAVRFLTEDDDATNHAIQRIDPEGNVLQTYANASGRAIDVITGDDEVPVLNEVVLTLRAQNSFGVV